jgi:hypothetical protein
MLADRGYDAEWFTCCLPKVLRGTSDLPLPPVKRLLYGTRWTKKERADLAAYPQPLPKLPEASNRLEGFIEICYKVKGPDGPFEPSNSGVLVETRVPEVS